MELNELETIVMELKDKVENILGAADEAEKKFNHDKGLKEFSERNGEALSKYSDKLKKLNGDDFDLMSSAYDEYTNEFSDIEEATYVAQLVSEIDAKLSKLKEALDDDHVMVESDGDETKVETHDEVIETESETANEEEKSAEEENKEEESEEESEEDAEADFMKDLEADYEKYKNH